jgi:GntR family transcriptional regulator/MocR family aminotransferase
MQENAPKNYIRLGFSAISSDKILPGLVILGELINSCIPQFKDKIC